MAGDHKANSKNGGKRSIQYASGGVVDELMSKRDRAEGPLAKGKHLNVLDWGVSEKVRADVTALRGAYGKDPVADSVGRKHIVKKVHEERAKANRKK